MIAANGKWCAYGYPSNETHPDWSMIEESADNGDMESTYQRGWITVDLPRPAEMIEVAGDTEVEQ